MLDEDFPTTAFPVESITVDGTAVKNRAVKERTRPGASEGKRLPAVLLSKMTLRCSFFLVDVDEAPLPRKTRQLKTL
jgi:hypothetical protein